MSEPTMAGTSKAPVRPPLVRVVVTGMVIGILGGFIEVGLIVSSKARTPILEVSRDFAWMAPLAGGLLAAAASALAWSVVRALPARVRGAATEVGVFAALLVMAVNTALYLPRLHDFAVLVLGAGVATVVLRLMRSRYPHGAPNLALAVSLAAVVAALALTRGERMLSTRAAAASLPEASSSDPNVVLISIDTGRAFNMSVYGYERSTTPWLDSIGSRGIVFDDAIASASWTLPSHASMFTGRWASELSTDYVSPLDSTFPTLGEYLSQRGYRTLGIVANLRYTGYETGLDRGFAEYVDYPVSLAQLASSLRVGRRVLNHPRLRAIIRNDQHLVRLSAAEINARALARISDDVERPVFLFLNYFDVHEPYLPPEPFDRRFGPGRARGRISPLHRWLYDRSVGHAPMTVEEVQEEIDAYDGSMAYLDGELRSLVSSLESRLRRPTLFIITGDHGEEFGEHRVFDHGNSLYYPSVRVPLVLAGLDEIPRGVRVSSPVSTRSIPHTVATLLGDGERPFPGASLARYWEQERTQPLPVFSEVQHATGHPDWFPVSKGDMASIRLGAYRYIRNGDGSEELYELERDVWETTNLVGDPAYDGTLSELRDLVRDHAGPVAPATGGGR